MNALPYLWRALQTRGDALQALGREAEAVEAYRAAVDIIERIAASIPDAEQRAEFLAGERVSSIQAGGKR